MHHGMNRLTLREHGVQHFLRLIRVLTRNAVRSKIRNIGTHRQQIVDQLRNAFMIKAGQRFRGYSEALTFSQNLLTFVRFAMLNGQPAISRQPLPAHLA